MHIFVWTSTLNNLFLYRKNLSFFHVLSQRIIRSVCCGREAENGIKTCVLCPRVNSALAFPCSSPSPRPCCTTQPGETCLRGSSLSQVCPWWWVACLLMLHSCGCYLEQGPEHLGRSYDGSFSPVRFFFFFFCVLWNALLPFIEPAPVTTAVSSKGIVVHKDSDIKTPHCIIKMSIATIMQHVALCSPHDDAVMWSIWLAGCAVMSFSSSHT